MRQIRARMVEIMQREVFLPFIKKLQSPSLSKVQNSDLKQVVTKLIPDSIGKDIEKSCSFYYPLQDVYIRKVKILKKPKFELGKLLDMHGEGAGGPTGEIVTATGEKIETRPDDYEPPVQESV